MGMNDLKLGVKIVGGLENLTTPLIVMRFYFAKSTIPKPNLSSCRLHSFELSLDGGLDDVFDSDVVMLVVMMMALAVVVAMVLQMALVGTN